jgi:ADP-ribose pyrophosphatase YjhB (NUDIX family)
VKRENKRVLEVVLVRRAVGKMWALPGAFGKAGLVGGSLASLSSAW